MATITERNGRFKAEVRRVGQPAQRATFDTKAKAIIWATELEEQIKTGVFRSRAKNLSTVREVFERFRDEVTPDRKGARSEAVRINWFIENAPFVGIKIEQLTSQDLQDFVNAREKNVSAATVLRDLAVIGGIMTWAKRRWSMKLQPELMDLAKPKVLGDGRRRRWPQADIDKFVEVAGWHDKIAPILGRHQAAWALMIAIETAMRLGEIASLRAKDFDASNRCIHLADTKNGTSRNVPLTSRAMNFFAHLVEGLEPEQRIFKYSAETLGTAFRHLTQKANLVDIRFHDSRHEGTTRLAAFLVNPLELAAVTGHKNLQSLKTYYNPTSLELAAKLG
jgi:integrase